MSFRRRPAPAILHRILGLEFDTIFLVVRGRRKRDNLDGPWRQVPPFPRGFFRGRLNTG